MKRRGMLGGLLAALLVMLATRHAYALWMEMHVTRNGVYGERQFTIMTKTAEPFQNYEVVMEPTKRAISPFLSAQLDLIANDTWIASVPVSETRENGKVIYRFRAAPSALAQSYLEISEGLYVPFNGGQAHFRLGKIGDKQVEQIMGGVMYRINLKDFARLKTEK